MTRRRQGSRSQRYASGPAGEVALIGVPRLEASTFVFWGMQVCSSSAR